MQTRVIFVLNTNPKTILMIYKIYHEISITSLLFININYVSISVHIYRLIHKIHTSLRSGNLILSNGLNPIIIVKSKNFISKLTDCRE